MSFFIVFPPDLFIYLLVVQQACYYGTISFALLSMVLLKSFYNFMFFVCPLKSRHCFL